MKNDYHDFLIDTYIDTVQKNSIWGKKQTLADYESYIYQELFELKQAINLNDSTNIIEELADVYMMLCFYIKESTVEETTSLQVDKILSYIDAKIQKYDISFEDIKSIVCNKLEQRYPKLFPQQTSLFFDECPNEESYWIEKKKYYKMLEFCTCTNISCQNYHKAYNGSNLVVEENKTGSKNYIRCSLCNKILCLKESVLFYGINKDYKILLKAIIEYFTSSNAVDVCQKYDLTISTLQCLKKRCLANYDVFKQIADIRYPQNNLPSKMD